MKTKLNFISLFLFIAQLISATVATAQTNSDPTQSVCVGPQPYHVAVAVPPLPAPVVYTWSISGGGTISSGQGTNDIIVDWTTVGGPFTLSVYTTAAGCQGLPQSVLVTVVAAPVGPTLLAKTPDVPSFCSGAYANVSATFNPGTGGVGGVDEFRYRTDGGAWASYTPGAPILTAGVTTSIEIEGRRTVTAGLGCTATPWANLATWNISAALTVTVTIAADPNPVCAGASVTFTATPVNGGLTPIYAWRVNGATQVGQTSSTFSYVPVNGDIVECDVTSSDVCGVPKPATSNTITMVVNPIPTTSPIFHN